MFTNVYEMFTLVYMKVVKSFRLSQEAVDALPDKNQGEFIEELILGKKGTPFEDYMIQSIDEIKGLLNKSTPPEKITVSASGRTKANILKDIRVLEGERESELEFMQDPDEIEKVGQDYQVKIDALWREYHEPA